MGLGYLRVGAGHPAVRRAAIISSPSSNPMASFPLVTQGAVLDGGRLDEDVKYHMIPLQTALPLLGLAWAGYAADPRAERAYDWLLAEELKGGWPSGRHADQYVFAGGYRRLAHSKFGCRTNTTAAVSALALHPSRMQAESARRGLDLLLAHEHRQAQIWVSKWPASSARNRRGELLPISSAMTWLKSWTFPGGSGRGWMTPEWRLTLSLWATCGALWAVGIQPSPRGLALGDL